MQSENSRFKSQLWHLPAGEFWASYWLTFCIWALISKMDLKPHKEKITARTTYFVWKVPREENCRMSIDSDCCLGTTLSLCHRDQKGSGVYVKNFEIQQTFKFSFPPRKRSTTVQQLGNYTSLRLERWLRRQIPGFKMHRLLAESAAFTGWSYTGGGCGHLHRPLVW